jgi:hypothetical protein
MDLRIVVLLAGAGAFLWATNRWRQGLQVVMVLLVVEGAIRKWLFAGAQDLVYLAKDVILVGVYIGYLRDRGRLRVRAPELPVLYLALVFAAVVGALQVFNPRLPNPLVGALGFKAYFLYVPLLFVVPAAFADDRELLRFLRRYIILSIPVGLLAGAQFLSPASSALNTYARATEGVGPGYVSTFGSSEFVRVTATFSYITGYSSYLVAMTILMLAYMAAVRWRMQGSLPVYVALGSALLGMLMTGSRGPIFMLALLFPLYWWLAVLRDSQGGMTFMRLLVGVALLAGLIGSVGAGPLHAFLGRAAGSSEDLETRLVVPFTSPFEILPDAGLFGYGIGATHQTATAVTPGIVPYSWLHGLEVEAETGRIMIELGPVGFFLMYFIRVFLVTYALRQVFLLRTRFHRAIATACLMFFLAQLLGSIVFDITADLYFWFFGGLLFLVLRLDRQTVLRQLRQQQLLAAVPVGDTAAAAAGGAA